MKKSSNKTIFFTLIFAAFIVVIGYYVSINNSNDFSSEVSYNSETTNDNVKGSIVYLLKESDENSIYSLSGDKVKLIFTDKDESLKIKSTNGITKNGKILVTLADKNQEFGGSLYFIDVKSGEKEKLIDEFASSQPPLVSPNGKKIAYIIFSNVETDYGFSLYIMDTDGSNKQKISNDSISIKTLSWNSESSEILYLKGDTSEEYSIFRSSINNQDDKKISSFKEKVNSIDWQDNMFVVSKGPSSDDEINKSEIYTMNDKCENIKRITNDDKFDGWAYFSPNDKYIVYIKAEYGKNIDINKSGIINIVNISDSTSTSSQEANLIIGWTD